MSVILEFTIGSDQFTLGRVLSGDGNISAEVERIVPTGRTVMPFLWVGGVDFDVFEERVQNHEAVKELTAVDRIDDHTLYRITWQGNQNDIISGITAADGTVLEAAGEADWHFQIRFPDHDRLSQFHNYCTEHDISLYIERTYTLTERTQSVRAYELSQEQREALILGLRRGYFDTPSQVSLSDLATELGISQQAVSNRIRRGTKKVLSEALLQSAADFGGPADRS